MKTLAVSALLALLPLIPARAADLGTVERHWPAAHLERVKVDFPVGELRLVGRDIHDVRARLQVRCKHGDWDDRCRERARDIRLVTDTHDGTRTFEIEGLGGWRTHGLQVRLEIEVPRDVDLNLEMGVGECRIEGLAGDLDASLGVGQMTLRLVQDAVRSVHLESGIGQASLDRPASEHSFAGFLGSRVRWSEGSGRAVVHAEVGVGEVDASLD